MLILLGGSLVSAVWNNIQVYAQSPATGVLASKSISPELKSIMCDPSNPDLKVVNSTEARICGIPKRVLLTYRVIHQPVNYRVFLSTLTR